MELARIGNETKKINPLAYSIRRGQDIKTE